MTWFVRWPRCGSPSWSWLVSTVRTICVFEGVRGCSRVWVGVLAVVLVVSVVWVACWLTTCVVLVWAFRVFEVVG